MPRRKGNPSNKGCLRRQLGIKNDECISTTLLNKIIKTKEGTRIINPSKTGSRRLKVNSLMIRRAILTKNLRKIRRKRWGCQINGR